MRREGNAFREAHLLLVGSWRGGFKSIPKSEFLSYPVGILDAMTDVLGEPLIYVETIEAPRTRAARAR